VSSSGARGPASVAIVARRAWQRAQVSISTAAVRPALRTVPGEVGIVAGLAGHVDAVYVVPKVAVEAS
jgi:hypothetical protein